MEEWEEEFDWLKVRHYIKDTFGKAQLPDLNAILFVIGLQELGTLQTKFSKEQKQDLMHIAVCKLLSFDGIYGLKGIDADGWPHYELLQPIASKGVKEQEILLKKKIIQYFNILENQNTADEEIIL
ncbi:MAG: hypothetical protein KJP00_02015 [Bacteroidia bacterium]|nr:hypothetical protein [Bacteroidia bacterium]